MIRKKNQKSGCHRSQSKGRQRQFTAPSSKGMPNLDSTGPDLCLSYNDGNWVERVIEFPGLEDLHGLNDYNNRLNNFPTTTPNEHRQFHGQQHGPQYGQFRGQQHAPQYGQFHGQQHGPQYVQHGPAEVYYRFPTNCYPNSTFSTNSSHRSSVRSADDRHSMQMEVIRPPSSSKTKSKSYRRKPTPMTPPPSSTSYGSPVQTEDHSYEYIPGRNTNEEINDDSKNYSSPQLMATRHYRNNSDNNDSEDGEIIETYRRHEHNDDGRPTSKLPTASIQSHSKGGSSSNSKRYISLQPTDFHSSGTFNAGAGVVDGNDYINNDEDDNDDCSDDTDNDDDDDDDDYDDHDDVDDDDDDNIDGKISPNLRSSTKRRKSSQTSPQQSPVVRRPKYSRQSISLVPGKGVGDVFDFTAYHHPTDSTSGKDDIIIDDKDTYGRSSEVYRVDSSFWVSNSRPKGLLYLVAHTKDAAHVIEDCKMGQVYVFQQLTNIEHLQLVRDDLGQYLRETLEPHVPVRLYRNNRDHSNSFCVVLNQVESVSPIIDSVDFDAIHQILSNVDPKNVHGKTRQMDQTRVSYGFATNTSQRRDESGSAVPNLLRGTMSEFTRQMFVIMSSIFFLSFLPSWAKYRGEPKRQVYAKIIAPDNEIEGLTLHKSSPSNLCAGHMDSNNPDYVEGSVDSQLSLVVGASKWVEGERVGLTGYFRKSITDAIERKERNAPMLEELDRVYSQFSSERKHMDPSTLDAYKKEGKYLDKKHVAVPCNLDPMGYHSLFIHATCVLEHVFLFSFPMIISALICMDIFPNCGYFYDLAVYDLVSGKISFDGDPWLIGRFIAIRMLQLRDIFYSKKTSSNGKRKKLAIFRFNSYKIFKTEKSLPTGSEWIERIEQKVGVCLFIWFRAPKKPNLASISGVYESCSKLYQKTVKGMGPLSAKHQFAVLSYLGCLPDWFRDYAHINGRVLAFFQKQYPELKWINEPGRLTMTTIQTYFHHRIDEWWSYSKLENVMCKVFRLLSPKKSDRNFVDVHRIDEILVMQGTSSLTVAFANGKMIPLDTNYLCGKWELVGEAYLSQIEIASRLFAGSRWTGDSKFPTLDELMSENLAEQIQKMFPAVQTKSSLSFSF